MVSVFGGSAWTWNEKRKQFYYHQFSKKQPDFNLKDPYVVSEMKSITRFWLNKGVSGVRLDATKHFMEDPQLRNEPLLDPDNPSKELKYVDYDHIHTTNLWETYEFIHSLREFVDSTYNSTDDQRILIVETYTDMNHKMLYYGNSTYKIAHYPFNVLFLRLSMFPSPKEYDGLIQTWLNKMPAGSVANWMAENHDIFRIGTRLNEEFIDIILITIMTLPGVACLYGQEIGMLDNNVRSDQIRDPYNNGDREMSRRDRERLNPMQWDDTMNAGFTSKIKSWLPVNSNYWRINVQIQKAQKISRYNSLKALSNIRKRKTMQFGQYKSYVISEWILTYTRSLVNYELYIVVLNLGSEIELVDLHDVALDLPPTLEVAVASINSGFNPGDQFSRSSVMRPLSAVVLTNIVTSQSTV